MKKKNLRGRKDRKLLASEAFKCGMIDRIKNVVCILTNNTMTYAYRRERGNYILFVNDMSIYDRAL